MAEVEPQNAKPRFQRIPTRYLLPNLITLLALCSGVTAIRLGVEQKFELAVGAVIFAILLDAVDGRLARYLEGTSKFGAELDSLCDFVNFGVAPAIMLHVWLLREVRGFGWLACLLLAVACALRLARFNVMLDEKQMPAWTSNYFSGVPAPAGAGLALAPFYLSFLGLVDLNRGFAVAVSIFIALLASLMVSRLPTFSGKTFTRVSGEWVVPLLAAGAAFVLCLISFPWETLLILALLYILLLPFGLMSFRRNKLNDLRNAGGHRT